MNNHKSSLQRPYRLSKVVAIALSLGLMHLLTPSSHVLAVQPPDSITRLFSLFQLWTADPHPHFTTELEPVVVAADVPLLDLVWFETLCRDWATLTGQPWETLSVEQQLAIADELLLRLQSILHPDAIEYLKFYNNAFVAAIAPQLQAKDNGIYREANRRVLAAFPEFAGDLKAIEKTAFNQVFTAAVVDVMHER